MKYLYYLIFLLVLYPLIYTFIKYSKGYDMNDHTTMTPEAIEANIQYYRNLYTKHQGLAREANKELWYWINVLKQRDTIHNEYNFDD